jgi:hypothetical protein
LEEEQKAILANIDESTKQKAE